MVAAMTLRAIVAVPTHNEGKEMDELTNEYRDSSSSDGIAQEGVRMICGLLLQKGVFTERDVILINKAMAEEAARLEALEAGASDTL